MKVVYPILNADKITEEWGEIAPFFDNLVDRHMGLDDVYASLMDGRWTLWVNYVDGVLSSIATTTFIYYPKFTTLRIILCAGAETNWADATEFLEEVAKANSCDTLEVLGRKGWERALRSRGFDFQNITLSKRLRDDPI